MEEQKHTETQQEGEESQGTTQVTEIDMPTPNATPTQEKKEEKTHFEGDGTVAGVENTKEEDLQNNVQIPENPNLNNQSGSGDSGNDGKGGVKGNDTPAKEEKEVDWDGLKKTVKACQNKIETKKRWSNFVYGVLIIVCLVVICLITRAFICDCENVTTNKYASFLLYGLLFVLIVVTGCLSYILAKSYRKYNTVLSRLELLVTRMLIKKDKSTVFADIDRELQLVARILESENIFK